MGGGAGRAGSIALPEGAELAQVRQRHHVDSLHERRLGRVSGRDRDAPAPTPACVPPSPVRPGPAGWRRQERAHRPGRSGPAPPFGADRSPPAAQPRSPGRSPVPPSSGQPARGSRDPALREVESGVLDRRADSLSGLADGRIRQADDRERGQPTADVDLDVHGLRGDTHQGEGPGEGEHAATVRPPGAREARRSSRVVAPLRFAPAGEPRPLGSRHDPREADPGAPRRGPAADRLERAGWRIVARNARLPSGELDLVALDRTTLVFVEVKAGTWGRQRGPSGRRMPWAGEKQLKLRGSPASGSRSAEARQASRAIDST